MQTLNDVWSLYAAAELRDPSDAAAFEGVYYAVSREDDVLALTPEPLAGASQERLNEAIQALEEWAAMVGGADPHG